MKIADIEIVVDGKRAKTKSKTSAWLIVAAISFAVAMYAAYKMVVVG